MDMERYLDLDGDSGVVGYEIGDTFIKELNLVVQLKFILIVIEKQGLIK